MPKIKVLIVEDSKLMQEIIKKIISSDEELHVVGVASNPYMARAMIQQENPDVITLDVMMPHMDGVTFLKEILRTKPRPVVMISALTEKDSPVALEALACGAVDFVQKPSFKEINDLSAYTKKLTTIIKNAAQANITQRPPHLASTSDDLFHYADLLNKYIIVIGASTGSVEALETILLSLPKVLPPIVIVQHIEEALCFAFIRRMMTFSSFHFEVIEQSDTPLLPEHIYFASSGKHVTLEQDKTGRYAAVLNDETPVNDHKPSIDVLFQSTAKTAGTSSIGILLTGSGLDGVEGLKAIHDAGGTTLVQSQETSAIWETAGNAVRMGAVDEVVPLEQLHLKILQILDKKALGQT